MILGNRFKSSSISSGSTQLILVGGTNCKQVPQYVDRWHPTRYSTQNVRMTFDSADSAYPTNLKHDGQNLSIVPFRPTCLGNSHDVVDPRRIRVIVSVGAIALALTLAMLSTWSIVR